MGRLTTYNYMKTPKNIADKDDRLSTRAMVLYIWLERMEQDYTPNDGSRHWFLATHEQISNYSGMSINTIKAAKKELAERGFIRIERGGWYYKDTGKSSIKQPCKYTLL